MKFKALVRILNLFKSLNKPRRRAAEDESKPFNYAAYLR